MNRRNIAEALMGALIIAVIVSILSIGGVNAAEYYMSWNGTRITKQVVEPAKPQATVILYSDNYCSDLAEQAAPYLKQGYQVKLIAVGSGTSLTYRFGYMVLERY